MSRNARLSSFERTCSRCSLLHRLRAILQNKASLIITARAVKRSLGGQLTSYLVMAASRPSSGPGFCIPHTPIAVDLFQRVEGVRIYFLTHMHTGAKTGTEREERGEHVKKKRPLSSRHFSFVCTAVHDGTPRAIELNVLPSGSLFALPLLLLLSHLFFSFSWRSPFSFFSHSLFVFASATLLHTLAVSHLANYAAGLSFPLLPTPFRSNNNNNNPIPIPIHEDHTVGLSSTWRLGPLYCTPVTRDILLHKIGVAPSLVVRQLASFALDSLCLATHPILIPPCHSLI